MGELNLAISAFNSGEVSPIALARTDLAKLKVAWELQENLFPKVLGPAIVRPGFEMRSTTRNNAQAYLIDFVFNAQQTAMLELTDYAMRPLLGGQPVVRPVVSATVPAIASWSNIDEPGTSSNVGGTGVGMFGTGYNYAGRRTTMTVAQPGVEHAARIVVETGPFAFRIGTAPGLDDVLAQTILASGEHSIAFTPTGTVYMDVRSSSISNTYITGIFIESGNDITIATPWSYADARLVRYCQSGDVVFCASPGFQQRRIERRSQRSWSLVTYYAKDGPFLSPNTDTIALSASDYTGTITLTSSRPFFKPGHTGALFQITTPTQRAYSILAGNNQFTDSIRVSGVGDDRAFGVTRVGTWAGTLTLQKSVGVEDNWIDVVAAGTSAGLTPTYTTNGNTGQRDTADNSIIYYRVGFKDSAYTSGSAIVMLDAPSSTQTGVVRIHAVQSTTTAQADVIKTISSKNQTTTWAEGSWSNTRGWPSSVVIHDGRLWWSKSDTVFGSVSDTYDSYDLSVEGDSGPVIRSVAAGGFEGIYWMLSLQRLLAGTTSQEVSIRSSSFDEPITPTAFTARDCSTRGNMNMPALKLDSRGIFVSRDSKTVYELAYDVNSQDYTSRPLTRLHEEICAAGVVDTASQRHPDTRVWFVLGDGTCAVLTYERDDEVIAWSRFVTDGTVESVCILPGVADDEVYLVVNRYVNGSYNRFIERIAPEADCMSGSLNKTMDSHVTYAGSATTTIPCAHLQGKRVVAWGDGKPLITLDMAPVYAGSTSVTLPVAASNVTVGLAYPNGARMKSTKLAYGAQKGTALTQRKRVSHLSPMMAHAAPEGVRIGRDFSSMTSLSRIWRGRPLNAGEVIDFYDTDASTLSGSWDTDSRICLQVNSPYGAVFMGLVASMAENERGTGYSPQQPDREGGDGS